MTWQWLLVALASAGVLLAALVAVALCYAAGVADELDDCILEELLAEQATRPHGNVYVLREHHPHDAA